MAVATLSASLFRVAASSKSAIWRAIVGRKLSADHGHAAVLCEHVGRHGRSGHREKLLGSLCVRQKFFNVLTQGCIVAAGGCDEGGAFIAVASERSLADLVDPPPARFVDHCLGPSSSRSSQSFPRRQSRFTVSVDT